MSKVGHQYSLSEEPDEGRHSRASSRSASSARAVVDDLLDFSGHRGRFSCLSSTGDLFCRRFLSPFLPQQDSFSFSLVGSPNLRP